MNSIDIKFTVEDSAAFMAWKRQAEAAKKLQRELDALKKKGTEFGRALRSAMADAKEKIANAGRAVGGMVLGWLAVERGLSAVSAKLDEIETKSREVGIAFDEAFRKFNIQAGLKGLQAKEAQEKIEKLAIQYAMPTVEVVGMAEQLVSSGFSAEEASGKSLDAMLKLMAGTNQAMSAKGEGAVSTKDLVQAVSSYLDNLGLDKSAESVERFGVVAQSAFKATNLQLEDFRDLAGEASNFRGILPMEEQVAMMSVIRDTNPSGSESATGMRNILLRTSAITEPTREKALRKAGLNKGDIDGFGEDYIEGLKKLRAGLKNLPVDKQNEILKVMFEERGVSFAKTLMQDGRLEEIQRRSKVFQDRETYESDVKQATSGKAAGARRLAEQENQRLAKGSQNATSYEEISRAAREVAVERGMSEAEAGVRQGLGWTMNKIGEFTGPVGEETEQEQRERLAALGMTLFNMREDGGSSAAPLYQEQIRKKVGAAENPFFTPSTPEEKQANSTLEFRRQLLEDLKADPELDAKDIARAKESMAAADEADAAIKGKVAPAAWDKLAAENRKVQEQLIQALDRNTKATENNSKSGGPPAANAQQPVKSPAPKNSQASRRLDRRNSVPYGGMG